MTKTSTAWKTAFEARTDLSQYGDNALGLFALALKFGIEDLDTVATDSITDGSDDKKCDIVYVNRDDQYAVISQCYYSQRERVSAPANKASDLNTAISWLLQRPLDQLPTQISSAAQELREAIESGEVETIHLWYIHNLPESENVRQELITVESSAKAALRSNFAKHEVNVSALEVGANVLSDSYKATQSPILVSDTFEVEVDNGYEIDGPEWKSYVTTISARFLYRAYKKHRTKLFSANVRDYLGSRASDSNINHSIKITAVEDSANFWVFNNGVTILTNNVKEKQGKHGKNNRLLEISGMSIVNGAQTTGAIGSLSKLPPEEAFVSVRFVQTSKPDIVQKIVKFNNSQNSVTASDFRSTDPFQTRLITEISQIPDADYEGGRRGGYGDAIVRRPNLLPSYTVGQALAAVHGDPITAYNQKLKIWVNDDLYARYFNDRTKGVHVIFAYALFKAVEAKKFSLIEKYKRDQSTLTQIEKQQLEYFQRRGSTYLLTSAISSCLETFLNRPIPNLFRLSFGQNISPKQAQAIWAEVVNVNVPLVTQLTDAFSEGLTSPDRAGKAIKTFKSLVEVTMGANENVYRSFAQQIVSN